MEVEAEAKAGRGGDGDVVMAGTVAMSTMVESVVGRAHLQLQ